MVAEGDTSYQPFARDKERMARQWALAGTPGVEHRLGGLEKNNDGKITSDPLIHERMVQERAEKVARVAQFIPELKVVGPDHGKLLLVGWGGTFGHLYTALEELKAKKINVSLAHFDFINPLPKNTAEVFGKFKKILVCELNNGQFAGYLRMQHQQFTYCQCNKTQGQPFTTEEIVQAVKREL
jgi:2-oxoglutarate ferredoxin oxidoreductase subunit alpha